MGFAFIGKSHLYQEFIEQLREYHICDTVIGRRMNTLEKKVEGLQFLEKLVTVVEHGEVDYWEDRKNPPNLSVDEFHQVLYRINDVTNLKWINRDSTNGPHGTTGEAKCFKFNCEVSFGGIFEIETKSFFLKGYFFDKGNLKGVTIQSFRQEV